MNEAELQLFARALSIDLDNIGADDTFNVPLVNNIEPFIPIDGRKKERVYEDMKRCVLAQGLIENLSNTQAGLAIRWILPELDFADPWGRKLSQREWWVPANGRMFDPHNEQLKYILRSSAANEVADVTFNGDTEKHKEFVFETNTMITRNDRKVMLLFGAGLGPQTTHTITSVVVKRGDVKTVGHYSLTHAQNNAVAFDKPIMFRRNDDMRIYVTYGETGWEGRRDQLVLFGFVVESLGTTVMG
jgi:hypothetical protein